MNILTAIDPRAYGPVIKPTPPLPHVSRKALQRVKHRVEIPKVCDFCLGEVTLVGNEELYGRPYGKWPFAYRCTGCNAYVGLHPDTDLPLGFLADHDTRQVRKSAKDLFHKIMNRDFNSQDKYKNRADCYAWLAKESGIDPLECHFSMFDYNRGLMVLTICWNQWLEGGP